MTDSGKGWNKSDSGKGWNKSDSGKGWNKNVGWKIPQNQLEYRPK